MGLSNDSRNYKFTGDARSAIQERQFLDVGPIMQCLCFLTSVSHIQIPLNEHVSWLAMNDYNAFSSMSTQAE